MIDDHDDQTAVEQEAKRGRLPASCSSPGHAAAGAEDAVETEKVRAFEVGPAPLSNFPRKFKGAGGDWAPRV